MHSKIIDNIVKFLCKKISIRKGQCTNERVMQHDLGYLPPKHRVAQHTESNRCTNTLIY